MADLHQQRAGRRYRILVRGEFGPTFTAAFSDVAVRTEDRHTVLVTNPADQAQLYGLLERLRNFAVDVVSFRELGSEEELSG